MVESYIKALKKEIMSVAGILEKKKLKIESIYIGGGTPTSIEACILKNFLVLLSRH